MTPYIAEFVGTMILILLGDGVVANVNLNKSGMKGAGAVQITLAWRTILYILISGTEIRPDFRAFHDLRGGKTTALDCSRYRCPSLPDALFARPPPEK